MIKSFSELPVREKVIKLVLMALIVAAAVVIFPKNYKIAVQNYKEREKMVVLTDPATGHSEEAWYFFQQGYYYISPIAKGPVAELIIGDVPENVDDVSAYYGSAKVGSGTAYTTDTSITYNIPKIVFLIILYALFSIAAAASGIASVLSWRPEKKDCRFKTKTTVKDAVLFFGLTILYSLTVYIISENILIKDIYPMEVCFAAVILFITMLVQKQYSDSTLWTALSSLPIYTCLYFSINKISAFTFIDGPQAIAEQTEFATDSLRHFQKNTARLNYIIMGTFERYNIIGRLEGMTAAKLMHWLFGAGLFVYLVYFVVKHLLPQNEVLPRTKALRFTALFVMVFTYNYTLTALKNYNYDLFSIAFGAIGFAYFLYAARTKNPKRAMAALVLSTLGALEKQIVWPFMLLCMVEYVLLSVHARRPEKKSLFSLVQTLKAAAATIAVSLSCNLWIQHVVRWDDFPRFTVNNLIRPLQGMMHVFVKKIPMHWDSEGTAMYLAGNIAGWIGVYMVSLVIGKKHKISDTVTRAASVLYCMFMVSMIALTVFLKERVYIDSKFLRLVWYEALSLDAFPTLILIGFIAVFIISAIKNRGHEEAFFIFVFVLVMPIVYVTQRREMSGRYFNIFGLAATICLFLFMAKYIKISVRSGIVIGAVSYTAIVAESIAFAPAYLSFFPVWEKAYKDSYSEVSVGIERLTAGEALIRYYDKNGLDMTNVELYVNYDSQWNAKPKGWTVDTFPAAGIDELGDVTIKDIRFGKDVYYVFTARSFCTNRYGMYPIPSSKICKPFMILKRRGAIEAWMYRADDLRPYFEEILPQ